MVIKKYIAESMSEALNQVRRELGEDAVILQSRKIEKGGLLNFLNKQMVEVTAATPDSHPLQQKPQVSLTRQQREEIALATGGRAPIRTNEPKQTVVSKPPKINDKPKTLSNNIKSVELQQFRSELTELKDSVRELADHMKYKSAPGLPEELSKRWIDLVDNGVNERTAHDITQILFAQLKDDELKDNKLIDKELKKMISDRIPSVKYPQNRNKNKANVIALIGPTGVGKTTTLAKMATNKQIYGSKKVALISTDTYRIAAVEQLQTFASIAGIPMEVVYRPEELQKAIGRHSDKDVILIDTAGRSHNDSGALLELREFIDAAEPDETLLVLSAGTRLEDQVDIVKRFGQIQLTRIILTKVDEISSAGHFLDIAEMIPRKWTFLTIGQNVPDDILPVEPEKLANWILNRETFNKVRRSNFRMV
ncbi:MAG: flagellar biosynthesis protein FlhF [Candidatus Electryonea clarkiae]|nr:flagellar biosynthesis protein FlhF [Candidatus Electryonea clarkiae]MDP8288060.1 flagellar biosynthesis protein FlhF [Candidatus Electryonea clarkiae]